MNPRSRWITDQLASLGAPGTIPSLLVNGGTNAEDIAEVAEPTQPPSAVVPRLGAPLENALYVGIDVSQEHLDAAVVDARGNLLRASQRYENTGPGFERLWDDTPALGRSPSRYPVTYAMDASGIGHLGLLAFLLEKKARTGSFNPLLLQMEKKSQVPILP